MANANSKFNTGFPAWSRRFLKLPASIQFSVWFAVVFALKGLSLFEPPAWDSAMGVFPPAIYLYENQFNIRDLLQEGNWWEGGPNVHSLSLFSWFLAVVMSITDSALATFVITRLTTFALFAWSLVLFTRVLIDYELTPRVIIAAACFLLLMPLMLVQVGYLYTETWVAALGIAAWAKWHAGSPGLSVLLAVLALSVKLTAIAITLSICIVLVLGMRPLTLRKAVLITVLPAAVFVLHGARAWLGATPPSGMGWGDPVTLLKSLGYQLGMIPDVTLLSTLGLIYAGIYASRFLVNKYDLTLVLNGDPQAGSRLICVTIPLIFLSGIMAMTLHGNLFLPRYLVPMIPFALIPILLRAQELHRERMIFGILVGSCALFLVNYDGRLYPSNYASFSVVERSHAYRDFHRLQIDAINALAAMPDQLPAFVSREIHYMVSSPLMGYIEHDMPQVQPIYLTPNLGRPLVDFPEEFLLLYSNPNPRHGGGEIVRLVKEAKCTRSTGICVQHFERGGFHGALYWIRKGGLHCQTAAVEPKTDQDALVTWEVVAAGVEYCADGADH